VSGPMVGGPAVGAPIGGAPIGGAPGPGMMLPTERVQDLRRTFVCLLDVMRPERPQLILAAVLAFVSTAGTVFGPRILGNAINQLMDGLVGKTLGHYLPAGTTHDEAVQALKAAHSPLANMVAGTRAVPGVGIDFNALGLTLLGLAGLYLAAFLLSWISWYAMAGVSQRVVYRLRRDVDEKLARLPLEYFDTHPRGDTLSRVTNDIDNISNTLMMGLAQIISSVATIVGVAVMMLWISPLLALVSLLVLPAIAAVTMLVARLSQRQFAAQWARTGTLNGLVEESHTGHAIVKSFGHQEDVIRRFDLLNQGVYEASFKAQFISGIVMPAVFFLGNVMYVAIAVIGGVQAASGTMSLGDVQAFIQYSRSFSMPITQTAGIANLLQSAFASAERVFQLLDEAEEIPDPAEPEVLQGAQGHVAFDGVYFAYAPEAPLIEDLNADIRPGEVLAIVGPTGAGKTTVVNLLMRFYELDGGSISLDGIDTRRLTRDRLRHTFGMVLQDTWLFGGTIRENIAYGREDATEEEIIAAAKAAHVDHFVRTMPHGYDTVIDDDASNLSQGEKQLLTIARAFLADPEILILDEATSSVDTRTEILVQGAMARLMKRRTAFVIAHRLSTIRNADEILVMDQGKIVEQGSHDDLMARKGFYYNLYNSQFEEAIAEAV